MAKKLDFFVMVYLNDIFIYIKNPDQDHIKAITWIPDVL